MLAGRLRSMTLPTDSAFVEQKLCRCGLCGGRDVRRARRGLVNVLFFLLLCFQDVVPSNW